MWNEVSVAARRADEVGSRFAGAEIIAPYVLKSGAALRVNLLYPLADLGVRRLRCKNYLSAGLISPEWKVVVHHLLCGGVETRPVCAIWPGCWPRCWSS